MKVYVENKDKDFLELCLKEHCVYDYIEYDSRYRDKLELVSLADYTKQVRKEIVHEIRKILLKQRQEIHNTIEDNSTDISYLTGHLDYLDVFEFEILD